MAYSQCINSNKIKSSKFNINELIQIAEHCYKSHAECKKKFKEDIKSRSYFHTEFPYNLPDNDLQKLIDENFKVYIEIWGDKGEYLSAFHHSEISSATDLPNKITKIIIGNKVLFKYRFNSEPSICFEITIDFQETQIFDLISNPSESTNNDSQIIVSGINLILVNGIVSTFESCFKKHRTYHGFIHYRNIYDILLWLVFFPLSLFYVLQYTWLIHPVINHAPISIQVVVGIIIFFILAVSFRLLFNLGRWLFPYMEITTQKSQLRLVFKTIYTTAITALFGAVVINVVSKVIGVFM